MKSRFSIYIAVVTVCAALAIPAGLAAQNAQHHHYQLIDMGTFGGPESFFPETIPFVSASGDLNKQGLAVGGSATSTSTTPTSNFLVCGGISGAVPFVQHAFEWQAGVVSDLGSLAGADYCSIGAINAKGLVVGVSENGRIDPLIGINQSRPVVWKDGHITDLGTFGGNQGVASSSNSHGLIVGGAVNTTADPYSILYLLLGSSSGTETRAFVSTNGAMQDLGTLGGPDAVASLVNERGQVAGTSYTNYSQSLGCPGLLTSDPFFWENGKMTDIGTLGGTCGTPLAMNNRGQVAGQSSVVGDATTHPFLWPGQNGKIQDLGTLGGSYGASNGINEAGDVVGYASTAGDQVEFAFLWRKGTMTNLGSLNGDPCSTANAINSQGQVVGISTSTCDYSTGRKAFLWENGSMVDLNTLTSRDPGMQLSLAETINDRGEIAVNGTPSGCGVVEECGHAVLLIPCDENHPGLDGCDYSLVDASALPTATVASARPTQLVAPSHIPSASLWRRNNRFRFPLTGPQN
jgi:probable HAF family extracellular repeat protein